VGSLLEPDHQRASRAERAIFGIEAIRTADVERPEISSTRISIRFS
jgi:hypothetical protein